MYAGQAFAVDILSNQGYFSWSKPVGALPMSKNLTKVDVVDIIRNGQKDRSLRAYAIEIGITPSYLSDIYLGRRNPGRKCLDYFGMSKHTKVTTYYILRKKDVNYADSDRRGLLVRSRKSIRS